MDVKNLIIRYPVKRIILDVHPEGGNRNTPNLDSSLDVIEVGSLSNVPVPVLSEGNPNVSDNDDEGRLSWAVDNSDPSGSTTFVIFLVPDSLIFSRGRVNKENFIGIGWMKRLPYCWSQYKRQRDSSSRKP